MKKIWTVLQEVLQKANLNVLKYKIIRQAFPGIYRREWKEGERIYREKLILSYECAVTDAYSIEITLIEVSGEKLNVETTLKVLNYIAALTETSRQIRIVTTGEYITLIVEKSILFLGDKRYDKTIKLEISEADSAVRDFNKPWGV
jgi:hypothetical protein